MREIASRSFVTASVTDAFSNEEMTSLFPMTRTVQTE